MIEEVNIPMPEPNQARCVLVWRVSELQGVLLTHIESLGLPERQEKAIKSMIKRDLWAWYYLNQHIIDTGEGKLEYVEQNWGTSKAK